MKLTKLIAELLAKHQARKCRKDNHDYPDSVLVDGAPMGPVHFYEYTCRQCGGKFTI